MEDDKIVIKKTGLPGVILSMIDFSMLASVKRKTTKVTKTIYKKRGATFIATKDQLEVMDVIQVGKSQLKYRVLRFDSMSDKHWFLYRIKRIDGNSTTQVDLDAVEVGHTVVIVNRQTFKELFSEYPHSEGNPCPNEYEGICPDTKCDK